MNRKVSHRVIDALPAHVLAGEEYFVKKDGLVYHYIIGSNNTPYLVNDDHFTNTAIDTSALTDNGEGGTIYYLFENQSNGWFVKKSIITKEGDISVSKAYMADNTSSSDATTAWAKRANLIFIDLV